MKSFILALPFLLPACASVQEQAILLIRRGHIQSVQTDSYWQGIDVEEEAYTETLKRWPRISDSGLQRRAIIYSMTKAQGRPLDSWYKLSEEEELKREIAALAFLRRNAL